MRRPHCHCPKLEEMLLVSIDQHLHMIDATVSNHLTVINDAEIFILFIPHIQRLKSGKGKPKDLIYQVIELRIKLWCGGIAIDPNYLHFAAILSKCTRSFPLSVQTIS